MKGVEKVLVLKRKFNQRIVIGDGLVTITVVDIGRNYDGGGYYVKLGFEADPSLTIHREEVYLAIKLETGLDTA